MLRLTARHADAWNTAWFGQPDDRADHSIGSSCISRSTNPRFCDSDLEADALMLPALAVQFAVRELNRDAYRPAAHGAAS
jgi:hypothetical protein